MKNVKKQHLPQKVCLVCKRPFTWRKKWEKVWDEVKYCSEKCRRSYKLSKKKQPSKLSLQGLLHIFLMPDAFVLFASIYCVVIGKLVFMGPMPLLFTPKAVTFIGIAGRLEKATACDVPIFM